MRLWILLLETLLLKEGANSRRLEDPEEWRELVGGCAVRTRSRRRGYGNTLSTVSDRSLGGKDAHAGGGNQSSLCLSVHFPMKIFH